MPKKIFIALVLSLIFFVGVGKASAGKISVFNFGTVNLEASGLGTTVTNLLSDALKNKASISLLDRKDLEAFLNFNDLQQNDEIDNVVNIGTQLGLDFVVVGSVDKRGSAIYVTCSVIQIDKKKEVYNTRVRAFGESSLASEIVKLSSLISEALKKNGSDETGASSGDKSSNVFPVNFQKIHGNKKIILRWREIPGFGAMGYEVYRALNQAGPFAMIGQTNKLEYNDQNVDNGVSYFYRVRAYDKLGRLSDFTPVLSASTDFAPNPPIILKIEGRPRSVLLTWVANPLKGQDTSKLAGYKIYRAKAVEGPYQEVAKLSADDLASGNDEGKMYYRDKSLSDGSIYFYSVAAFNSKDIESEPSNPLKGIAIANVASVNAQSDLIREVKLKWAKVQSPLIVAYNIYRGLKNDSKSFTKIKKINVPEINDDFVYADLDGLTDKTNYFYYVTAEDDSGMETGPSPVAQATTRDIPPRTENFAARSGLVKKVELSWTAAKQEEVEGYNIYWAPEKDGQYNLLKKISGRENNSYLDESRGFDQLADNKTYYYKLTAFNKVTAESLPALAFATTKPRPQKPAGLKGEALKVKEAPLTWQANPEKDIATYHIYRTAGDKDDFSKVAKVDKTSYVDKSLKDGVTYRYKIQAEDKDALLSDYSEIVAVNTKPRPKAPEGFNGAYDAGKVKLSWKPNQETDISQYIVYEKSFFNLEKMAEVKSTNYTDSSIVKGKSKTYVVTAVDRDGLEGEPSAELTVSAK